MTCNEKFASDSTWVSSILLIGKELLDYNAIQQSFHNPADRAWFFTNYLISYGSQSIPEQVLTSIGLHPNGYGTFVGSFGEGPSSTFAVYGSFTRLPEKNKCIGTVAVTKAYFTVHSDAWPKEIHMDYSFCNPSHAEAHIHWGTSNEKYDLNTQAKESLLYIAKALSPEFIAFFHLT